MTVSSRALKSAFAAKRALFAALVAVLFLVGCAGVQDNLVRTNVAFNQTVAHATQLRQQGVIDDATAQKITPYINKGSAALDAAWAGYLLGEPQTVAQALATVNAMLVQLVDTTQEAQP